MPRRKRSNSPFELLDDDFDDRSSQSSRNDNPPIQRNAANARERARMRVLSSAFGRLKTKLPNIPADTKLSKLDTLRLATMYIKQLKSVVEGGPYHHGDTTNGDILEGSANNSDNGLTNCYLNLNSATQSMNWPFGLHHQHHIQHLTTTSSPRMNTTNTSMAFINATNSNSSNNWCPNENNNSNSEQLKYLRHQNDKYHQSEHQKQQQQSQYQNLSFMQHTTLDQQHNHHWYSETPSPELDSTSSPCLTFENIQLVNQQEQHHHHHRHHHVLTHLQPASIHSSSTFHAAQNFLDHTQQRHQHQNEQQQHQTSSHHLSNGFGNSANFQSTSIR